MRKLEQRHLYLEQLSSLQQKILKHFFECAAIEETVSHISKEINALQPAVFRSISSLINEKYLIKEKGGSGVEKVIKLTEKGSAAAVILGVKYDKFEKYSYKQKTSSSSSHQLQMLLNLIKEPEKKDILLKKAMEFFTKNNYFGNGNFNKELWTMMVLQVTSESINAFNDIMTIQEFVKKYNLDAKLLKSKLEENRENIDSLLFRFRSLDNEAQIEKGTQPFKSEQIELEREEEPTVKVVVPISKLEEAIHKAQKINATDLTLYISTKVGKLKNIVYGDISKIANAA
jgi:hypothetical protein